MGKIFRSGQPIAPGVSPLPIVLVNTKEFSMNIRNTLFACSMALSLFANAAFGEETIVEKFNCANIPNSEILDGTIGFISLHGTLKFSNPVQKSGYKSSTLMGDGFTAFALNREGEQIIGPFWFTVVGGERNIDDQTHFTATTIRLKNTDSRFEPQEIVLVYLNEDSHIYIKSDELNSALTCIRE
jgi:hypothetical protein